MGKSNATLDRESNEEIQAKNRESQEKINQQNIDFQRENLEYQKALQQQVFEREDTSYQRTVNDMRSAGLSPLTMNGTNSAGEVLATSPISAGSPYREEGLFNRQQEFEGKMRVINDTVDTLKNVLSLPSQMESIRLDNEYKQKTINSRVNSQFIAETLERYKQLDAHRKAQYDNQFGLNDKMSLDERLWAIYATSLGMNPKHYNWSLDVSDRDSGQKMFSDPYYEYEFGKPYGIGLLTKNLGHYAIDSLLEFKKAFSDFMRQKGKNKGKRNGRDVFEYDGQEYELPF